MTGELAACAASYGRGNLHLINALTLQDLCVAAFYDSTPPGRGLIAADATRRPW